MIFLKIPFCWLEKRYVEQVNHSVIGCNFWYLYLVKDLDFFFSGSRLLLKYCKYKLWDKHCFSFASKDIEWGRSKCISPFAFCFFYEQTLVIKMILGNQTVCVDQVMCLKARISQIFEGGDIMVIHLKIRAGKNINLYIGYFSLFGKNRVGYQVDTVTSSHFRVWLV